MKGKTVEIKQSSEMQTTLLVLSQFENYKFLSQTQFYLIFLSLEPNMSVKSFNQQKSSFTPYQNSLQQKELSLFSRLNLNENDKSSLDHPMRNFVEYESSDLFSMRSKKRKGSAEIQLKESLPGNRTYLNVSLVGKSSLLNNDLFGHQHYQDLGLGEQYDDEKKEFSQKSCPVGPSYNFEEQIQDRKRNRQIESEIKPRFHKTKNMLRTIGSYLHKYILHNKRSNDIKQRYFQKVLMRKLQRQENEQKISLQIFEKIRLNQDSQHHSNEHRQNIMNRQERKKGRSRSLQKSASQEILSTKEVSKMEANKMKREDFMQKKTKLVVTQDQINQKILKFHEWVETLSMINFADYERIWSDDHEFTPLYKQICYKYYKEEVLCDVMRSRLTTKQITIRYMHQFLQGLFNPKQFYRFK